MKKRLIWNFEVMNIPLNVCKLGIHTKEMLRWERRYFWPESTIISLSSSLEDWLSFSNCSLKQRKDYYFLLNDNNYNLKQRKGTLVYKPILEYKDHCIGFDKKINLSESDPTLTLPGSSLSVENLLKKIEAHNVPLFVEKTALIYKLPTEPKIKLELARLVVQKKTYFTACIEGYSLPLVRYLGDHLLSDYVSCDYVTFLKQNCNQ